MTVRPEKAYACLCTFGIPRPFIHTTRVSWHAHEARAYIGVAWARAGETVQQGWRRAYKAGWRLIRVEVRPV